jgi:acetyl-CoA carboxylase beta subunit
VPEAANAIRSARERIALVVDAGSFQAWDADLVSSDPLAFCDVKPYASASPKRTPALERGRRSFAPRRRSKAARSS